MTEKASTPLNKKEIEQTLRHGSVSEISETLVTLALYDEDWKKVEGYCLEFLEYPDASIRAAAATCIGHLARIRKQLDLDLVLSALYRHQSDLGKYVAGNVDNALDDIEIFMHVPVKHDPSMMEEENIEWEIDENDEKNERLLTAEEIEQAFQSNDLMVMSRTLLALALYDPDWRRTEDYCLQSLEHANASMRGFAAECISHLIYNQHHLDVDLARSALSRHQSDPDKYVARRVKYALSDIKIFENTPV